MKKLILIPGLIIVIGIVYYAYLSNKQMAVDTISVVTNPREVKTPRHSLKEIFKSYSGSERGIFLEHLAIELLNDERIFFVEELKNSFENDPINLSLNSLEHLSKMKLKKLEIEKSLSGLCHFKKDSVSWNQILKILRAQSIDIEMICK